MCVNILAIHLRITNFFLNRCSCLFVEDISWANHHMSMHPFSETGLAQGNLCGASTNHSRSAPQVKLATASEELLPGEHERNDDTIPGHRRRFRGDRGDTSLPMLKLVDHPPQ